jgi:enoyl-CoA hydratase
MSTEQPAVLTERRDNVLVITLNRPEARNAVNLALAEGVAAALDELDAADDLSVGILTGAGSAFCAGMDLKAFAPRPAEASERALARVVRTAPAKPLLAAIEGFAVGGGCELALVCDIVVAARDAVFGLPEVRHGLVPAGGGILRLPARIAFDVALEMALTGDLVDAARLHELGLVNRLTEPGAALDGALELAGRIADNAPLAVGAIRRFMWERAAAEWEAQEALVREVNASRDAREGIAAFAEKRRPVWSGR